MVITSKPSIFIRLGNIIIIQVMFIFSALALILFYPVPGEQVDSSSARFNQKLIRGGEAAMLMASTDGTSAEDSLTHLVAFRGFLSSEANIDYAAIVHVPKRGAPQLKLIYDSDGIYGQSDDFEQFIAEGCDSGILVHTALGPPGTNMERNLDAGRTVLYYVLGGNDREGVLVLVAVVDNSLAAASLSEKQHTIFVLFLFSTLVSLLTVYLVYKRFKQPLDRLIRGFEKTADGELYYLIEAEEDAELNQMAGAFNRMSQRLWDNRQELKSINTRLKNANLTLQESQAFLSTLIDDSPLGIVVADGEGLIRIFNQAASDLFDYPASEMLGGPIDKLFSSNGENLPVSVGTIDSRTQCEVVCRRKEGSLFPACVVASPVGGNPDATIYVLLDISESKGFQEMMIRLDRYWTRGEMAGDIAHEINNFLAILLGNLELMPIIMAKGDDEKITKKLDLMKDTVDKIARFANGLMDSSQEDGQFELSSVNQLMENIIAFVKPQNRFDLIEVISRPSADVPILKVDPGMIQQLLVNLMFNAAEAMGTQEGEKRLTVTTSMVESDAGKLVQIEVRDNGPGVVPERVQNLFVERFTTKRKGHGIGLITCHKIVELHGGTISYRYDNGSVFSVQLPVQANLEQPAESQETAFHEHV